MSRRSRPPRQDALGDALRAPQKANALGNALRASPSATWHVYVLRCRDGALYTGIATDVARRLAEHSEGRGAKYLRGRGPLALVLKRRIGERGLALSVEHALKRLPRARKEELVLSRARVDAIVRAERRRTTRRT